MIACYLTTTCILFSQKYDYNYLNRVGPIGSGAFIQYSDSLEDVTIDIFQWEGTATGPPVLSDKNGNLLGFFNSHNVYDSIGRIAINGDSMPVGYFLNYYLSFFDEHHGFGNGGNAAFIPITDSLFYLLYKSAEVWIGAPDFAIDFEEKGKRLTSYSDGLYLSKVRLNADHRLFIMDNEKQILLVDDLFQFEDLMLCKHGNGHDWWLLTPKALNNQAVRLRIHENGEIEHFDPVTFSDNYWRVRSKSSIAFSPNGDYLVRLIIRPDTIFKHLFEVFTFDRCEGTFERILCDSIPLTPRYTSGGDIEFSENGRYIYVAIGEVILQMDLQDSDFFANRDTIAEWDGFLYTFLAPLFDALWRLPNGKILVASSVATPYLHYIHDPDKAGKACMFEQRAIKLPSDPLNEPFDVNIETLP